MPKTKSQYKYSFPAIQGYQAGRQYFVAMCALNLIPKLFRFTDDEETDPVARAQRKLNKSRIPELASYLIDNPETYVFSALTASVDGDVEFRPLSENPRSADVGTLHVEMGAKFQINDGQHRRAAIEEALRQRPVLNDETIAVVLFVDRGLIRSQQMFTDLNKNAVRPTKSLGILYDHRDEMSQLARSLMAEVPLFQKLTEPEKSAISNRSKKLFTLSTIYFATRLFLKKGPRAAVSIEEQARAREFWIEVCKHMKDWNQTAAGKISSAELRRDYIHAHGVAMQAIALAGAALLDQESVGWKKRISKLAKIDWSRTNHKQWEGRAMVGARMNATVNSVTLTANVIKGYLGVKLSKKDLELEKTHGKRT
jgi:DNA sulfur modification protein DndB